MLNASSKYILDNLIAPRESGGNYDAYLGHEGAAAGTLTSLTIAQVYAFQRKMTDGGAVSTACGKYQFIQRTLNACAQYLGVNIETTHFDAAFQDQAAAHLMDLRGFTAWNGGTMPINTFLHNLSCEWASLPDPFNGGKSHYDGEAGNHAGWSLSQALSLLTNAKRLMGSAPGPLPTRAPHPSSVPISAGGEGAADPDNSADDLNRQELEHGAGS